MMQKILIVEDNPIQQTMLTETIQGKYKDWNVLSAFSYTEAKKFLEESLAAQTYFSLFLLDIQLSEDPKNQDGFCLAEEIRKKTFYYKTPILFLTAVSDKGYFALSHFHCYNYIAKPYTPDDILVQLNQMLLTGYLENETIKIKDTSRIQHRVVIKDIYKIESHQHVLTLYTKAGEINTREYSLADILGVLGTDFIRCHKRIILNKLHLCSVDKSNLCATVGTYVVPVGKTYIEQLENL